MMDVVTTEHGSDHQIVEELPKTMMPSENVHHHQMDARQEEIRVFYVLVLIFMSFLLISFLLVKVLSEQRRKAVLPLLTFVSFCAIDAVYRHWTERETAYGSRPFEIAFFRTVLVTIIAKLIDSRFFGAISESSKSSNGPKAHPSHTMAIWFVWFPFIGFLWAVEESLSTFPESFIGVMLTYAFLCMKTKSMGSKVTLVFAVLSVAGMLMAKTGAITIFSIVSGFCRTIRIFATDFVVNKHGPISPFALTWGPGITASSITFLVFLSLEFFVKPSPGHVPESQRGLLDFLSAAVLGSFFTLASMLAMFEIMSSASIFSLNCATCLVELLVFCVLTPLSGLPILHYVILPLNIVGFVIGSLSCLILLKTDAFASTNMLSNALFKFLDEEEEQAAREGMAIKEIGEDEWLLTLNNKKGGGEA